MTARIFQFLPVILLLILISCEQMGVQPDADNTPPKARLGPSMVVDSTRPVILNASRSSDAEDMPDFLEFRWDLNGDGIWDTEFKAYPYLVKYFPVPGTYHIRMEVTDRHGLADQDSMTVKTYGFNNDTARFVDPRDGQSYPMVKLAGVWWMAENLNFGQMIPDTQLSRNNGIYEKYCYQNDPNFKGPSGGFYTFYDWDEVINYDTVGKRGLCPPGWKLPSIADWDSMRRYSHGDRYISTGGFSRLNLTYMGIHELTKTWETIDECLCNAYWLYFTSDFVKDFYKRHYIPCPYVVGSSYFHTEIRFVNDSIFRNGGALPVRCIKSAQ